MIQAVVPIWNPSFDSPFTSRHDPYEDRGPEGVLTIAHGWGFDYVKRLPGEGEDVHRRPEWGEWNGYQKMFTKYGTTKAVMYQVVKVKPGDILRLEATARYSSIKAGLGLVVGICPNGNVNPWHQDVVWGEWQGETSKGEYHWPNPGPSKISEPRILTCKNVEATGEYVTIFLRIENMFPGEDVSTFWESAQLLAERDEEPGPDPEPEPSGDLASAVNKLAEAIDKLADAVISAATA